MWSNIGAENIDKIDTIKYRTEKNKLHSDSNIRLKTREATNYEIKNNPNTLVNRLSIDRDEFFKQSKFDDDDDGPMCTTSFSKEDTMFRGLPARSEFNIKQNRFKQNVPIDLNVSASNNGVTSIAEYDPTLSRGGFSTLSESTLLTHSLQDDVICANLVNDNSLKIFTSLLQTIRMPFVINGLSLVQIFASLYIGSNGNTTIELKNYFNLPHKNILMNGFEKISQCTPPSLGNCTLFNQEITFNQDYCKKVSFLSKFRKINCNNVLSETINLNKIISTSNPNIKKIISSSKLKNLNVLLLTFGILNPTLLLNTYLIEQSTFKSVFYGDILHKYLSISNQLFGYVQNKSFEILEMMTEEKTIVGFVKTNFNAELNKQALLESISELKPTLFKSVKIPIFNVRTKLKLKNLLIQSNVQTIFKDLNVPELFRTRTSLDDILQNFEFDIGTKIGVQTSKHEAFTNSKNFIIDSSFLYYVKIPKINLIIMVGIY